MDLADYWYVACASEALGERPLATELRGAALVLFRQAGGAAVALSDRCPHRNVALSLGRVRADELECAYHGWRFAADGRCTQIPGSCSGASPKPRVARYATCERDGYVWVWGRADVQPDVEPPRLLLPGAGYGRLRRRADYAADLHASIENTIDVPHTMFLHRGLLRASRPRERIRCSVTRGAREVVARYQGERRPATWLARLLAPGAAELEHEDRFILPSIVRVEYRVGSQAHLISTACFTPLSATRTRLHAQVAYRLGHVPASWLKPVLSAVAARVLREDAEILRLQSENIARFGGVAFASSELDAFSEQIRRLLLDADAGQPERPAQGEHTFELMV